MNNSRHMIKGRLGITIITISIGFLSCILFMSLQSFGLVQAQVQDITNIMQTNNESQFHIPPTISNEAQEILGSLIVNLPTFPFVPNPDDLEGWKRLNQETNSVVMQFSQPIVDSYHPNITATKLGDINVIDVKPRDWKDNGKVLVYAHGGGYTLLSANSTLGNVAPVANSTGLRVVSVDYSLAPSSNWNQTTDEMISVIKALENQGYSLDDIAMYGDSAGGGLVAGSVLKMRDQGLGMPAALVLWSPWTDVTGVGDTYFTLSNADPFITNDSQRNMAAAYADQPEQKHPYVSPVYGNFTSGFPPTLIQGGTKEMLLSDFVRLYQALDQADIPVKLDIYEGMPHVFQTFFFHNTTESNTAISKTNDFLKEYLDYQ